MQPSAGELFGIAAVERDCGISKDTLRVWERRYGFPRPGRDAHGERVYPVEQVEALRLLRRLIANGYRPNQVVGRATAELRELAAGAPSAVVVETADADAVLSLLSAYQADRLRETLSAMLVRDGLRTFAAETAPGLMLAVGAAWARGDLEIHQEHLFTEHFTRVLRSGISVAAGTGLARHRPNVLLSTFPQEPHALGLLMAEAMFALEGCACVSLGVQTPISDIAAAARAHRADILALSFSAAMPVAQARAGLEELRALVEPRSEIWVGGACPGLRDAPGIQIHRELSGIGAAVAAWRRDRAEAGPPQ